MNFQVVDYPLRRSQCGLIADERLQMNSELHVYHHLVHSYFFIVYLFGEEEFKPKNTHKFGIGLVVVMIEFLCA